MTHRLEFWHDPNRTSTNDFLRVVEDDFARWPLTAYRRERNLVPIPLVEWLYANDIDHQYELEAERRECGRHFVKVWIDIPDRYDAMLFKKRWMLSIVS